MRHRQTHFFTPPFSLVYPVLLHLRLVSANSVADDSDSDCNLVADGKKNCYLVADNGDICCHLQDTARNVAFNCQF